ncbi:MAG: hypothetical protein WBF53_09345 [Litorimonas sp.]
MIVQLPGSQMVRLLSALSEERLTQKAPASGAQRSDPPERNEPCRCACAKTGKAVPRLRL